MYNVQYVQMLARHISGRVHFVSAQRGDWAECDLHKLDAGDFLMSARDVTQCAEIDVAIRSAFDLNNKRVSPGPTLYNALQRERLRVESEPRAFGAKSERGKLIPDSH